MIKAMIQMDFIYFYNELTNNNKLQIIVKTNLIKSQICLLTKINLNNNIQLNFQINFQKINLILMMKRNNKKKVP